MKNIPPGIGESFLLAPFNLCRDTLKRLPSCLAALLFCLSSFPAEAALFYRETLVEILNRCSLSWYNGVR